MKFYNSQRIGQPYKSWKDKNSEDVKNIFIPKNVLNSDSKNSSNFTPWGNCSNKTKYKFNANPLKHYRKQYVLNNNYSFSNNSYIGLLDKPGNYIVSNDKCEDTSNNTNMYVHIMGLKDECSPKEGDKTYDSSLNKTLCIAVNPQSLIIKRANTKLDSDYCSSQKEYIYKKCKTFEQNLPSTTKDTTNGTFNEDRCNNDFNNCKITFNPSNRRYQVQGPVTSSTRISSLKYGCNNWNNNRPTSNTKCNINSDFNNPNLCSSDLNSEECKNKQILSRTYCIGCPNDTQTIRRKRINILK